VRSCYVGGVLEEGGEKGCGYLDDVGVDRGGWGEVWEEGGEGGEEGLEDVGGVTVYGEELGVGE